MTQLLPVSKRLSNLANNGDCDRETYCKQGEAIFTELADLATGCRDLMADFRAKLAEEEISCNAKLTDKR